MRIICCGNAERGDDGAALLVADRLRGLGVKAQVHSGEALALLETWDKLDDVIVVDAMVTGAAAGTMQLWEAPLYTNFAGAMTSTHGLGVGEAIQLAHILGRLPKRLRVYGIEGKQFRPGDEISPEVKRAAADLARQIADEIEIA